MHSSHANATQTLNYNCRAQPNIQVRYMAQATLAMLVGRHPHWNTQKHHKLGQSTCSEHPKTSGVGRPWSLACKRWRTVQQIKTKVHKLTRVKTYTEEQQHVPTKPSRHKLSTHKFAREWTTGAEQTHIRPNESKHKRVLTCQPHARTKTKRQMNCLNFSDFKKSIKLALTRATKHLPLSPKNLFLPKVASWCPTYSSLTRSP